jgi:hypothetical protein
MTPREQLQILVEARALLDGVWEEMRLSARISPTDPASRLPLLIDDLRGVISSFEGEQTIEQQHDADTGERP